MCSIHLVLSETKKQAMLRVSKCWMFAEAFLTMCGGVYCSRGVNLHRAYAVLQVQSSPLQFTAEGLLMNAHIYVSDGVLQVPDELR